MSYKKLEKEIYDEELRIEQDCGMYYILDMYSNILAEFDTEIEAKVYLEELRKNSKLNIYKEG